MINKKFFVTALTLCAIGLPTVSTELSEIDSPKDAAYRVGLSSIPETRYIEAIQQKANLEKKYSKIDTSQNAESVDLTYADLSIKRISREIAQELEFDQNEMVSDLSLLWQGAAVQSDTINFTLYKLANPDADKPDSKSLKKVLSTIAGMSTLVGAGMSSPIIAGSSLIGGNLIGIMSQDTKALNYKYTKVSDADMIILIRKVEDLQQKAVNLYYDYMSAKQQLEFSNKLVEERRHKFELAQKNNAARELVVITDAQYRMALDKQRSAKSEFFSKRAALEQFVGNETFVQFEQELLARENGETSPAKEQIVKSDEKTETEYNNTIQNVEEFTNSIQEANYHSTDDTLSENYTGVANISELPPLEQMEKTHIASVLTGSSADVENNTKKKKGNTSKKVKADKKQNKAVKKETKNPDKYSTKGLIFLHNKTENQTSNLPEETYNYNTPSSSTQPSIIQQNNNEFNFAPLDAIKAPDLTPGGYSIHGSY